MRNICIIPARCGSKGLPGKNIKEIAGKPLIGWAIEQAQASGLFEEIICSTDSEEIAQVAASFGCAIPYLRPPHLAGDNVRVIHTILDLIDRLRLAGDDPATIFTISCTSPLRTASDIVEAYKTYQNKGATSLITVSNSESPPFWMYTIDADARLKPLFDDERKGLQRQKLPITYRVNGAIYINDAHMLKRTGDFTDSDTICHVMSLNNSVDIDSEDDFLYAEFLLQRRQNSATSS